MRKARSLSEIMSLFNTANKAQVVASSTMNSASTRGHIIYTIQLIAKHKETGKCKQSKFNIVEIAGPERINKTACTGQNLKKAIKVNLSYSTLISVVESIISRPGSVNDYNLSSFF